MCETNTITQIVVKPLVKSEGFAAVNWLMKRSDGFIKNFTSGRLLEEDALLLHKELTRMEEIRLCKCRRGFICNNHLDFV